MKIRMISGTIVLIGMTLCASAAEKRTYPCHRLAQSPVVDGKMDDEAWKNIPEATGFYIFKSEQYALEKQTYFKAGWTEDALYLVIRAEESAPEKMVAKLKDGGELWSEDSIELFFFPKSTLGYTQLVINSAGRRFNGRGGPDPLNVLDCEAKAVVGKTEWFLELRIPFTVLMAQSPKEEDEWPVNVARNILTGPSEERFTCWPALQWGFLDVNNFGRFIFKGAAGDKAIDEEKEINGSYIRDMHGEIRKLADMAGKYEKDLAEAQKSEKLRVEAEKLRQVWEQAAANAQPDIRGWREALRASVNLQQKSDECIARRILEVLLKD